jgi:hypothetical protein
MQATTAYKARVKNEDYVHFCMTSWSRNHQQIAYSPYFVKCNMQLGMNIINDTIVINHKYKLLH